MVSEIYKMNPIEKWEQTHDVILMVEQAHDFGKGIGEAYLRLAEKIHKPNQKRDCYGIIVNDGEAMQYNAGFTEIYEGEASENSISTMQISKGVYYAIRVSDWNQNLLQIGPTFDQLLKSGRVDTSAPCIEFYRTEQELICMVKAKDS